MKMWKSAKMKVNGCRRFRQEAMQVHKSENKWLNYKVGLGMKNLSTEDA